MTALGNLLRPLFGVSEKTTSFSNRDREAAQRLKTVVNTVTKGCQLTLQNSNFDKLVVRLNAFDPELCGFAYEGAGIGLAALDCLLPWGNRTRAFLDGPGSAFIYAVPLGAGMGLARLHRKPERYMKRLDPVLCWLIVDGYGFHEGFFASRRTIDRQVVPAHLSAYGRRAFDHGVGRSIWFTRETNPKRVATTIATFPENRRPDLWRGIGLACGYTGGVERAVIEELQGVVGDYLPQLALGVAIASNARHSVGNPSPNADLASLVVWGRPSRDVSRMVDEARENVTASANEPAYEVWRQRIEQQFTQPVREASQPQEVQS
jgi:hypothetical protein